MATVAEVKKSVADWVKWAVVLSYAVLGGVIAYRVSDEHRLTKLESDFASHQAAATKTEAELRGQLLQQQNDGKQILSAITAVQVEVAKLNGYLESRKTSQNQ
jgi:hypothetical protein